MSSFATMKCVRPCSSRLASPPTIFQPTTSTSTSTSISTKPQSPITLHHHHRHLKSFHAPPPSSPAAPPPKLSERWEEFQGVGDWEGLLDPLDDTLRREIIRYGHFVEAAYRSCDFDPSSPSYASCLFSKSKLLPSSGLPATGYRVTKNLTATSGIQLPGWADKARPNWMATQSSWIGYVAVSQDRREISRLGRHDVVIALRGTATPLEWLENMRATLTPLPNDDSASDSDPDDSPMVESGFLSLYTSSSGDKPSLQTQLREEITRIIDNHGGEPLSLTITGHSLGAALATLAAYDIKRTFKHHAPLVTVISFAGPRVGNWSFRCGLEEQGAKVLRIVNSDDVITKVPGFVVDNNEAFSGGRHTSGWLRKLVEDMQWVYADVGCELRLSSRHAPDLDGIGIATCHELKTYLHLVNGFVSSNCPFRATARKMINKTFLAP